MKPEKSWISAMPALALAASLAWVQPALSQDKSPSQDTAARHGGAGITLDQFVARQTGRLMAADTDGDGRISRAEMAAMSSAATSKSRRDPLRLFDAMDTNHDGYLDKDEIRGALEKRFHRMDLNGDGILTPDERMAGRPRPDQQEPASMSAASQP